MLNIDAYYGTNHASMRYLLSTLNRVNQQHNYWMFFVNTRTLHDLLNTWQYLDILVVFKDLDRQFQRLSGKEDTL